MCLLNVVLPNFFNVSQPMNLLIIVKSSVEEFDERNVVRNTWGKESLQLGVHYVFSVGWSEKEIINRKLFNESVQHKDILQINVIENYHHLALKKYMTLKWIIHLKIKNIFFTDTDIMIFPKRLKSLSVKYERKNNLIFGYCWLTETQVVRDSSSKSCIPKSVWSKDTYPPFCSGAAHFFSGDVARKLLDAIPNGADNWRWAYQMDLIEDVAFTGILREGANVTIENVSGFMKFGNHANNPCLGYFRWITSFFVCKSEIVGIVNSFRPPNIFETCWNEYVLTVNKC